MEDASSFDSPNDLSFKSIVLWQISRCAQESTYAKMVHSFQDKFIIFVFI